MRAAGWLESGLAMAYESVGTSLGRGDTSPRHPIQVVGPASDAIPRKSLGWPEETPVGTGR